MQAVARSRPAQQVHWAAYRNDRFGGLRSGNHLGKTVCMKRESGGGKLTMTLRSTLRWWYWKHLGESTPSTTHVA